MSKKNLKLQIWKLATILNGIEHDIAYFLNPAEAEAYRLKCLYGDEMVVLRCGFKNEVRKGVISDMVNTNEN